MLISSPNFSNGGMIPRKFTQQGEDISPAIEIKDLPEGAKSIVLVCMDPDAPDPQAPKRTFIHWIVYNLPAVPLYLPEGADPKMLYPNCFQGLNDRGKVGYIGPKPPIGIHRYYFKAFAADCWLKFEKTPSLKEIYYSLDGRVVAMAEYMGRYKLL